MRSLETVNHMRIVLTILCFLLCSPAFGFSHGIQPTPGKAQLNFGRGETTAQSFINLFHAGSGITFNSGATPMALGPDGFPTSNFTGNIQTSLDGAVSGTLSTTGPWILGWDAGVSCNDFSLNQSATITNATAGITILNGSGSGAPEITGNCGHAGSMTVNFNSTAGLILTFNGSAISTWNQNTSGRFYLVRQSDLAAFNAGQYWTPEEIALWRGLRPESIRFMGLNVLAMSIGTNVVNWSTRKTPTTLLWSALDYPPSLLCNNAGAFCSSSAPNGQVTLSPASSTSLAGWVDGEQIIGSITATIPQMRISSFASNGGKCQFTVPDTSALSPGQTVYTEGITVDASCNSWPSSTTVATVDSPTLVTVNLTKTGGGTGAGFGLVGYQTLSISGKAGGSKLIVDPGGLPLAANTSASYEVFTYNATMDKVIMYGIGLSNSVPIEAQVQFANIVGANYWYNFPTWVNDNFVTNASNLIFNNLRTDLKFIAEWSNEVWNPGQNSNNWSIEMRLQSSPSIGTGGNDGYHALRVRQINGNLIPASNWSGSMSRVDRLYCIQGSSDTQQWARAFIGFDLGNYGGGSPYNASPNRPIDVTDHICYAPYTGGGAAFSGQALDASMAPTTNEAADLNTVVSDTNAGNIAGANAIIDGYVRGDTMSRVQTVSCSGSSPAVFTTPLTHNLDSASCAGSTCAVRFTVTGGNTYGGLNPLLPYRVVATPSSTTFNVAPITNGLVGSTLASCGAAQTGTTSVGYIGLGGSQSFANPFYTVFGTMTGYMTHWQDVIGNPVSNGISPAPVGSVNIREYEGSLEPTAPTSAQCTALSISAGDCITLGTAVNNYLNSSYAEATVKYYFDVFMGNAAGTITTGAMPNSSIPSWLVLNGGGVYGLNGTAIVATPTLRRSYQGFYDFSGH